MARAKKLPSGTWRVQAYSHRDSEGKRHFESFTASTKAEAEMKAAAFAAAKHRRAQHDLTVGEAIDGYIRSKENVLSPSTITGYVRMRDHNFKSIEKKRIRTLTSETVQQFISEISMDLSPKTVRNVYGLLTASVALYDPNLIFRVTLPAKRKYRPESPSDEVVKRLFKEAYPRQKICIGLGLMGLREGEVAALDYDDLQGDVLHINKDMVRDRHGKWIVKEIPKTVESDRYITLPPYLVDLIGEGTGRIVPVTPNTISKQFIKLRDKLGLTIRFHDLRHFFASTGVILKIPELYLADMGGWERGGNSSMKTIYQNNMSSMSDFYRKKMANHVDLLINEDAVSEKSQHESQHAN
ncbi:MAG: hypothetical protein K6E90_09660 [Lachnospiraceae bacterium]|nr:hypothetical protein [Lachnospiraceae bacterium]